MHLLKIIPRVQSFEWRQEGERKGKKKEKSD